MLANQYRSTKLTNVNKKSLYLAAVAHSELINESIETAVDAFRSRVLCRMFKRALVKTMPLCQVIWASRQVCALLSRCR